MRIHRWITDTDMDGFFQAQCLTCGLVVLDAPVFDQEVYPFDCETDTGHNHRMVVVPDGARCCDCDLTIHHIWTAIGMENT